MRKVIISNGEKVEMNFKTYAEALLDASGLSKSKELFERGGSLKKKSIEALQENFEREGNPYPILFFAQDEKAAWKFIQS